MAKVLDNEIYDYFTLLNEAEKKSVIQMLKTFVKGKRGETERLSIEQYNLELEHAETEYQRGEYVAHDEFVKQIKNW